MKLGAHTTCVNKLTFMGFTLEEARIICSAKLLEKQDKIGFGKEDSNYDASSECLSYKIPIIKKEHPDLNQDQIVAIAAAWCERHRNSKKDAFETTNMVSKISSFARSRLGKLVKNIKSHKGLQVGGMGLLPFKVHLPMKNINRLQTKMEKIWSLKEQWLTAERLAQRQQYALLMKKEDSEFTHLFKEFVDSVSKDLNISRFEVGMNLVDLLEDNREVNYIGDSGKLHKFVHLNNVIKVPITLATEMIQEYENEETGYMEKHFKPYEELKMAIQRVDSLPMTIEHSKIIKDFNTIGYVKELRSDDKSRSIKGMGYFEESKLPKFLFDAIKRGDIIGVSIGFICRLGGSGIFNGKMYDKIQEGIIPNHVAICIDSTPRCPPPFCGTNLDSIENSIKSIDDAQFTIINKNNYLINICKVIKDSKEKIIKSQDNVNSKKSDKKIKHQDSESSDLDIDSIKEGLEDSIVAQDIRAFLKRLQDFIHGKNIPVDEDLQTYISRMLKAFNKNQKGEKKKMTDELESKIKELADSISKKDTQIEELIKKLEDADTFKKEVFEEKRQDKIKVIKDLAEEKFDDAYFEDKSLKDLTLIADAVLKFTPSNEKAKIIDVKGNIKKEDATEKLKKEADSEKKYDLNDAWKETNDMYGFDLSKYE